MTTLFMTAVLVSCSPSTKITGVWKDARAFPTPNYYKSVFVVCLSSNATARAKTESAIALQAERRGFKASKSIDYYSQNFTSENAPTKEQILKSVKDANIETILTVALVNKESETRFVPGTTVYTPYTYGYGSYGYFGGYYGSMYSTMYNPGYYTTDKNYFVETNLYKTSDEKLIWSAQSKTVNPDHMDDFINGYMKALGEKLQADGVVSKPK